jgi:DNA-binding MarR family transcriptional regulator
MDPQFLRFIAVVESAHRSFMALLKLELENNKIREINNVQAMLLFNLGDAQMTVGELILRGCYLGSNVSYNVKKLIDTGYLLQERSIDDGRVAHVRLSEKGLSVRDQLSSILERHAVMLQKAWESGDSLQQIIPQLRRLEQFWIQLSR